MPGQSSKRWGCVYLSDGAQLSESPYVWSRHNKEVRWKCFVTNEDAARGFEDILQVGSDSGLVLERGLNLFPVLDTRC